MVQVCGRYAASKNVDELVEEFEVERVEVDKPLEADYNVAPTKSAYAVLSRADRDAEGTPTPEVARRLRVLRWGLVPSWAKDVKIGSRMINARADTAATKPAYRRALARRRCIVPADGYYEWYRPEGRRADGKPHRKQPFFIARSDGGSTAMAGLYEFWRDPQSDPDDRDAWVSTLAILTTDAAADLASIHDRMPVVLQPEDFARWLDPDVTDPADIADLMAPAPEGRMHAYPVSTLVNSTRNNGPELLAPVAAEVEPDQAEQ